ncbi:hypothetical protein [Bacillus badius]|uniref:Uncharacterized protein n=1 Tax=Bacillus badius TaxID=1455 RepID=A0ABR5B062_BACBA|nr:hypothetical protein [Bacillus badius]KIL73376.1 hypothetical protein SD78_3564 [Bacillus badius]KIL80387.1 hypothetical protein SD77_0235 [Bacillus badius]KZR57210.1 hypothetical protein A3781_03310 [Bacillus badius]MED4718680.1 hypothetical protein [Bacillus badius]
MAQTIWKEAALEWTNNCSLHVYDPSIGAYRLIASLGEAKKLIKQSSEPFIRTIAAVYAFSLTAMRSTYTEIEIFTAKLEREARQFKKWLAYSPPVVELFDHLLETSKKSQSINGIKTDIYHEAIRLSIQLEDRFGIKENLKRQA